MEITYSRSCDDVSSLHTFSINFFKFSWTYGQVQDQLTNKSSINYFAYLNNELVGYIFLNLNEFSHQAHLYQICVNPSLRSKGLGKKLIELSSLAMQGRYDSIFLEVDSENSVAIKFYERLSFEKLNKITSFYSNGSDAYAMHTSSSKLAKELKS